MLTLTSMTCVCDCGLKEKQLELSVTNLLHIYSMAGPWRALSMRSKGQKSRSQCYELCCWHRYAWWYDC